jgi:5,10-methenyltetrahydromethanopterin hydrogenase
VDSQVDPGQTYWYWLEDIALSGAATLHGPVSAMASVPTAVTLAGISAGQSPASQTTGAPLAALPAVVALAMGAGWTALRRRR